MIVSIRLIVLVIAFSAVVMAAPSFGDEIVWRPVTQEELQMKTPKVEADADAEAIFWEVRLDDKKLSSVYYDHYIRVKIFTDRGREKFSKFDIPFTKGKKIENLAARVIKPDGSIVVLNPKDIFERELVKVGKFKVMAKSFALPGIEPGVIVEYQYRELYKDAWSSGVRLIFQRDIPVQKLSYHVRPQKGYKLVSNYYNMPETRFVEDSIDKGFFVATANNVPAYKVEPNMPPEDEVRRWAYVSYSTSDTIFSPWRAVNRNYHPWLSLYAKPTDSIRTKGAELTANAATDDEKLRRIYDFVQKQIKNVDFDDALTDEDREKLTHEHAQDTLRLGMGNTVWVELLFASLAKAAGFEVNLLFASDRSDNFFHPEKYPFASFIKVSGVAVNVKSDWKYFSPSVPYIPYGYLEWTKEGVNAMLVAENGFLWQRTPYTGAAKSLSKRTAKLKLTQDGTLEGTVRLEYFGQQSILRRSTSFRLSQTKREELLKDQNRTRISTSETSDVVIENFNDNSKPLVYLFNIRIPNYAQKTGRRIFVQPGFFEYGVKTLFSSANRVHGIYFSYPWSEQDLVEIELPKGFELDSADQPAQVSDPNKIGFLRVLMNYDKASSTLRYKRDFFFGEGGGIMFPPDSYPGLKNMFDAFHKADSHIITLKQTEN